MLRKAITVTDKENNELKRIGNKLEGENRKLPLPVLVFPTIPNNNGNIFFVNLPYFHLVNNILETHTYSKGPLKMEALSK